MAKFKDNEDREWNIRIDAPAIMQIREDCDSQFLFDDGEKQNTYQRLQSDPVLLCRVIFLLCAKQRSDRGITEEEFYFSVIGDAIDSATEAILKAIVFFTPKRTRELLSAVAKRTERMQDQAIRMALEKINDPAIEEKLMAGLKEAIDADIESRLTRLSNVTDMQGSSESTRAT